MLLFDSSMLIVLPALLLTFYAQWKVSSTFSRYSEVATDRGLSGAEAAHHLARRRRLPVSIEPVGGSLTDHFDPNHNVLRLSEPVYGGHSVAAVGVAAHELGHALQKAENYPFLQMRSGLVPMVGFSSSLSTILIPIAILAHLKPLLWAGIALFSLAVIFALVTLPVEFDASRRALVALREDGLVTAREEAGVRDVLNAAALTYVAGALLAITQLLQLIFVARREE